MKRFIIVFGLILFFNPLKSQISEYYFTDTEQKDGGGIWDHIKYDNSIIMAGQSFEKQGFQPAINRIDTMGNVMWSTLINDTGSYPNPYSWAKKILLSDGYLYALIVNTTPSTNYQFWKIDVTNGNILWKNNFYSTYQSPPTDLVDYDSSKFLVAYYDYNLGADSKFALIDKNTGDTLSTHQFILNYYYQCMAVDHDKNIYYAHADTIYKVSGNNPDSLLWKKVYGSGYIYQFQHIYIDQNDSIFLFGPKGTGFATPRVIAIEKDSGNMIWNFNGFSAIDCDYQDMVEKNGYLYVTWRHAYIGSGTFNYWTSKIEKSTGVASWYSSYHFMGLIPGGPNGNADGPISMDVADNGDAYITGYYGDANYGPANWGILKLNGINGTMMFEKTITLDSANFDELSVGMAACVFNNTPYFLGHLQNEKDTRTKNTFLKLDAATGNTLIRKYIGCYFQYPSKTLYINNYPPSQTLVMKQTGRTVTLEMYDFTDNLLWSKNFEKEYYLAGHNLSVSNNSDIFFSASSDYLNAAPPYYTGTDSFFVFQVSGSGNLINEYSFEVGSSYFSPVELLADSVCGLLFYQFGFSNRGSSEQLPPQGFQPKQIPRQPIIILIHTQSIVSIKILYRAYLFATVLGSARCVELNKSLVFSNTVAYIPNVLKTINHVLEIDTGRVILCGKDNFNHESIGLYSTTMLDTVWAKRLSLAIESQVLKCVADIQKNYVYTIGQKDSDIMVRKISVIDGQIIWTYSYNGAAGLYDSPVDIFFDPYRFQILISGYETSITNDKSALVLVLDTSGIALDTLVKAGDFAGDNYGFCTNVLFNGSQWVGGNINKTLYGPAGFIYVVDDTLTANGIAHNQLLHPGINIFPNPFSNYTTVEITSEMQRMNMKLELYNMYGQKVKEFLLHQSSSFIIDRRDLVCGIYTYHLSSEKESIGSGKVVIVD